MIKILTTSDVRNNFAEIAAKAHFGNQAFLIQKQKRPYVAMIGVQSYEDVLALLEKKEQKQMRKKPSCLARIAKIKCRAKVPKDFSLNHDKYLADIYYETSFRGSQPFVIRDKHRKKG